MRTTPLERVRDETDGMAVGNARDGDGLCGGADAQRYADAGFCEGRRPRGDESYLAGSGRTVAGPDLHSRVAEIRALHPKLIRLFVQEYYDVLPAAGKYHFDTLDQSVDDIIEAGAIPLMTITIKPKVLYPKVDQDIIDPDDYGHWEQLIGAMVDHDKQKGLSGFYWEVGNEGDIGEMGGSPNRYTPENYTGYYRHTIEAVLRADPTAHVGGPAVAGWKSPILPALIAYCDKEKVRLDFVSWHIYKATPRPLKARLMG